jgi:DNA-binding ferritin-like protein (Dps family)
MSVTRHVPCRETNGGPQGRASEEKEPKMVQQTSMTAPAFERQPHADTRATRLGPLPADFRAVFAAFAAYVEQRDPNPRADAAAGALEDLIALFAQAAADGIPVRDVVGHDPADIAEDLLANHAPAPRDAAARTDLARTIDAIVADRSSAG